MNSFEAFASEDGVRAACFHPRPLAFSVCVFCVVCMETWARWPPLPAFSLAGTPGFHHEAAVWLYNSLPPLPPRQIIPSTGSSPQISRHDKHLPVRPPLTHQRRSATKADNMFWGNTNQSVFFFLLLSWNNRNHARSLPRQKGSFLGGILIK